MVERAITSSLLPGLFKGTAVKIYILSVSDQHLSCSQRQGAGTAESPSAVLKHNGKTPSKHLSLNVILSGLVSPLG